MLQVIMVIGVIAFVISVVRGFFTPSRCYAKCDEIEKFIKGADPDSVEQAAQASTMIKEARKLVCGRRTQARVDQMYYFWRGKFDI